MSGPLRAGKIYIRAFLAKIILRAGVKLKNTIQSHYMLWCWVDRRTALGLWLNYMLHVHGQSERVYVGWQYKKKPRQLTLTAVSQNPAGSQ
jgi:hypothetical protein